MISEIKNESLLFPKTKPIHKSRSPKAIALLSNKRIKE